MKKELLLLEKVKKDLEILNNLHKKVIEVYNQTLDYEPKDEEEFEIINETKDILKTYIELLNKIINKKIEYTKNEKYQEVLFKEEEKEAYKEINKFIKEIDKVFNDEK